MTIAPPTPSRPATNAPTNPSASRVRANASVTGSAPNLVGPALTQARVVRREIPDLVVRDRLHQRFERRSEEHTSELQSLAYLVCRLLLEKKKKKKNRDQMREYIIS